MKIILLICIICCVVYIDTSRFDFSIKGEIEGIRYGKVLLLTADKKQTVLFATDIDEGKFDLRGTLDSPGRYILKVNRKFFTFFLDGHKMTIHCLYDKWDKRFLKGSSANDMELLYTKLLQESFQQKYDKLLNEYKQAQIVGKTELMDQKLSEVLRMEDERFQLTYDFVKEYPDNIYSAYISNVVKGESYEKGKALYALLSRKIKNSYWGRELKEHTDALAVSALGVSCPNFMVISETGENVTLNSLKGHFLVLDFWASWCGACRAEMKNLRAQHEEFKEYGVCFMSISLDDSVKKWEKACEEENIPWLSAWDGKGWENSELRKLFGIQTIPFIVLLDKNGNIVAKNIRRNNLREKIIELLQNERK